jgi:hypothetical protein
MSSGTHTVDSKLCRVCAFGSRAERRKPSDPSQKKLDAVPIWRVNTQKKTEHLDAHGLSSTGLQAIIMALGKKKSWTQKTFDET